MILKENEIKKMFRQTYNITRMRYIMDFEEAYQEFWVTLLEMKLETPSKKDVSRACKSTCSKLITKHKNEKKTLSKLKESYKKELSTQKHFTNILCKKHTKGYRDGI